MHENKKIIYYKSDWGKQVIYIVLILSFLFFSYKKNPTKELFTQELIREYAVKNGLDVSSSMWVSQLSNSLFGGYIEPLVKRNDYVIFSTYKLELNNDYFKGKIEAIGFWDNIIFYNYKVIKPTKRSSLVSSDSEPINDNSVIAEDDSKSEINDLNPKSDLKIIELTNDSNYKIFFAYAFYNNGWESIGWINIDANTSKQITLPDTFAEDSIYWYAENSDSQIWQGSDGYFCISHPDAFHNYSQDDCSEKGGFRKLYLTGEKTPLCCFEYQASQDDINEKKFN